MAAGLTALMILLFLGNWRLTLIILASIPLSIITAVLVMYFVGQTLNTMTLGGFALAVGILVDNATVVIENIERHLSGCGKRLERGDSRRRRRSRRADAAFDAGDLHRVRAGLPAAGDGQVSVFAAVAVGVAFRCSASLVLSFTLVPVLFKYLMRSHVAAHQRRTSRAAAHRHRQDARIRCSADPSRLRRRLQPVPRDLSQCAVAWCVSTGRCRRSAFFLVLIAASCLLFPRLGDGFLPAGRRRPDAPARARAAGHADRGDPGTISRRSSPPSADIVGNDQIDVMLDNIGLPYSGINIALSDSATVGPMDGEILISLKENHTPDAGHMADLRRELAAAVSRTAVLLPAGGHRQPGA